MWGLQVFPKCLPRRLKLLKMPMKQSAWEGGKSFTELSSGSTVSTFRDLWHSRCVILAKLSRTVHVLDYPDVPSIPLQSFTGAVLHSWEPVGTCTGELRHPVLLVSTGPLLSAAASAAQLLHFLSICPSLSSPPSLDPQFRVPSLLLQFQSSPPVLLFLHSMTAIAPHPTPTQETVPRATHNAVESHFQQRKHVQKGSRNKT